MSRSWPRPPLHVVASSAAPLRRTGGSQMSPANAFEGRGRSTYGVRHRVGRLSPRTVTFAQTPDRQACKKAWSRFVRISCVTRPEIVRVYGVTFQTACNWWDGNCMPHLDKVSHAFTVEPVLARQLLTGL